MRALCIAIGIGLVSLTLAASPQEPTAKRSPAQKVHVGDPALVQPKFAGDTTVFVPNPLPIFIDGRRLEAVGGGHTVTVDHTRGLLVDGVVYMPMPQDAQAYEPASPDQPFGYYVTTKAAELAHDALARGATAEQARQIMLDFWAQYADSLEVLAGKDSADLTFPDGRRIIVVFPKPAPENMPSRPTPLQRVLGWAEELVRSLNAGNMLLRSGACLVQVPPEEAAQALDDLAGLPAHAEVRGKLGDETIYRGYAILDGRYKLCPTMVGDLIQNQR